MYWQCTILHTFDKHIGLRKLYDFYLFVSVDMRNSLDGMDNAIAHGPTYCPFQNFVFL